MPRMGTILCPAWHTIAEQTLPLSLSLVAYLDLEYIWRFGDSGMENKEIGVMRNRGEFYSPGDRFLIYPQI